MKPRVESWTETNVKTGARKRVWVVRFEDGCGCLELEEFRSHAGALRFALHIANGGDRWAFL